MIYEVIACRIAGVAILLSLNQCVCFLFVLQRKPQMMVWHMMLLGADIVICLIGLIWAFCSQVNASVSSYQLSCKHVSSFSSAAKYTTGVDIKMPMTR